MAIPTESEEEYEEVEVEVIQCPQCGHVIEIEDSTRPLVITCDKCGVKGKID